MNTRAKRYRRWPCELTDATMDEIRKLAAEHDTSNLEMTRRLINHALVCPLFLPDVSSGRKVQPPADT